MGTRIRQVRTPNTYDAIERLKAANLIEPRDAEWLRDAYLLLNRVRNHMFLLRGLSTDALPSRDEDVERLARSLGFGRLSRSRFLERYMRMTRRARRVTDRLFYGEELVVGRRVGEASDPLSLRICLRNRNSASARNPFDRVVWS